MRNRHFSKEDTQMAKRYMKICSTVLERMWRKGTLLHCWWEYKLIQPLWQTVWRFHERLKIELLLDPAISLLGQYLKKNIIQKDKCTLIFTAALLFTIAKTWKQQKCPSAEECVKKMYTYIQWNIIQP